MKKPFVLVFAVLTAIPALLIFCCKGYAASYLPDERTEIKDKYELTLPYILKKTEQGNPPVVNETYFPVNVKGLTIKGSYLNSDGREQIYLSGEIESGIPSALRLITQPGRTYIDYPTDYMVSPLYSADENGAHDEMSYNNYESEGRWYKDLKEQPVEDIIALKTLYDNPNYTAVTISGFTDLKPYIRLKEESEALRLLTREYYDNTSDSDYNPEAPMMFRVKYYSTSPLFFLREGIVPLSHNRINRGGSTYQSTWNPISINGKGAGFSFLIWDGTPQKTVIFSVSDDGDKTWNKTEIYWEDVTYKTVPLEYVTWYALKTGEELRLMNGQLYVKANHNTLDVLNRMPDSTGIYRDFTVGKANGAGNDLAPIVLDFAFGSTADNFVVPAFYPPNSSMRQVYLIDENGNKQKKCSYREGAVEAEIADRILINGIDTVPEDDPVEIIVGCDTYPPGTEYTYPDNPLVIRLYIPVVVGEIM